jgi:L-serine dehydratase
MNNYGVFDILGPVMIGPSSSHTAGAARLGKVAAQIAGGEIKYVDFYLHGSFAKTYKGHGTDRALTAGILGMEASDERLKNSLNIAEENGIKVSFFEKDLGDVHPNTVKIVFGTADGREVEVIGSSIGGGSILITNIDGEPIEFTGEYPTIIIKHNDRKGMISKISSSLAEHGINIATMKVNRQVKGEEASMTIECDNDINSKIAVELTGIHGVKYVRVIKAV